MKKINKQEVLKAAELVFVNGMKLVGYALGAMLIGMSSSTSHEHPAYDSRRNRRSYYTEPMYPDAIEAVMSSTMLDHCKNKAISIIRKEESSTYYKSVISIVNSNMLDHFKIDAIREIS